MNIQYIQIAQGLLRSVEGKMVSGKGNISAESVPSLPEINLTEAQEKTLPVSSNLSKEKGSVLDIFYPPFFPLGHTQGIYSATTQLKPDSSSPDSMDIKIQTETIVARRQVATDEDESIKNKATEIKETANPGSVLDLRV